MELAKQLQFLFISIHFYPFQQSFLETMVLPSRHILASWFPDWLPPINIGGLP